MRRIQIAVLLLLPAALAAATLAGCGTTGTVYVPGPVYTAPPSYGYTVEFQNSSYDWGCAVVVDGNWITTVPPRTSFFLRVDDYVGVRHSYICDMVDACGNVVYRARSGVFDRGRTIIVW